MFATTSGIVGVTGLEQRRRMREGVIGKKSESSPSTLPLHPRLWARGHYRVIGRNQKAAPQPEVETAGAEAGRHPTGRDAGRYWYKEFLRGAKILRTSRSG